MWGAVCTALDDYLLDFAQSATEKGRLAQLATAWVGEKCPQWPWVSMELLRILANNSHMLIRGRTDPLVLNAVVNTQPPLTQDVDIHLPKGMSRAEALRRLHGQMREVEAKRKPRGRVPSKNKIALLRGGGWLCQHDVLGMSYRSIAGRAFPNDDVEIRKKDVWNATQRARKLLTLPAETKAVEEIAGFNKPPAAPGP